MDRYAGGNIYNLLYNGGEMSTITGRMNATKIIKRFEAEFNRKLNGSTNIYVYWIVKSIIMLAKVLRELI